MVLISKLCAFFTLVFHFNTCMCYVSNWVTYHYILEAFFYTLVASQTTALITCTMTPFSHLSKGQKVQAYCSQWRVNETDFFPPEEIGCQNVVSKVEMFCSFPMSSADAQRFSMEENEYSGQFHHYCPHHIYSNQEALGLTLSKPSESTLLWLCSSMSVVVLRVYLFCNSTVGVSVNRSMCVCVCVCVCVCFRSVGHPHAAAAAAAAASTAGVSDGLSLADSTHQHQHGQKRGLHFFNTEGGISMFL